MRRPPIETIRRLALVGAITVALAIGANYGWRRWRAHQARQSAPASIPGDVQQQAERFTFYRSEQGRTLFTILAGRTIERQGKTTVLEDVSAVIHGHAGDRSDELHTERCEYDAADTEEMYCPGEVRLRLGREAEPNDARSIQLVTRGVRFEATRGVAWTDQAVKFFFPEGEGEAVGLRYQPQEPAVILEQSVRIQVPQADQSSLWIHGSQLQYFSRARRLELLAPLKLESGDQTLVAERVRMQLDEEFRTEAIDATGSVRVWGRQEGRNLALRGRHAVARYAADGRIETLTVDGAVRFESWEGDSRDTLECRQAVLFYNSTHYWVERVEARGEAVLVSKVPRETRELRAPVLHLALRVGGRSGRRLTASERGRLRVVRDDGEWRTIEAQELELLFEQNRLRFLSGTGTVRTQQARPGQATRQTTSEELRTQLDSEGELERAEQWGRFHYQDGRWQAEAGRAEFDGRTETIQLREKPVAWDATTRTTARLIELEEKSGQFRAEDDVRTTQRSPQGKTQGFGGTEPIHIVSERMQGERRQGWARYEGRARLWQGENRLAAAVIELFRDAGELRAETNASALFLEQLADDAGETGSAATGPSRQNRRRVAITSDRFHYREDDRRGVFTGQVTARNDFGVLQAPRLEIFLRESGTGSERVERARASGGVEIEQVGGWARSQEAEYRAADQTVALWGGTPTLFDRNQNRTMGARLTLFLADDTVLVESAEGTRTVTRRAWAR